MSRETAVAAIKAAQGCMNKAPGASPREALELGNIAIVGLLSAMLLELSEMRADLRGEVARDA